MQDQGHGQPVLYLSSRLSPIPSSMKGICPQGLGTTLYPLGSGCLWGSLSGLPSMNDSSFSLLSYPRATGADFSLITELLTDHFSSSALLPSPFFLTAPPSCFLLPS